MVSGDTLMPETGIKLWIRDIVQGNYEPAESGYGGSVTTPTGKKVSRVRILGTVVEKFISEQGSFANATIDDSTETINIRAFKENIKNIEELKAGDIVDVLGEINEYKGEVYVLLRTLKKVDINWELLRRIELNSSEPEASKEVPIEDLEKVVMKKLSELEKDEGVKLETLINDLKDIDENVVLKAVHNLMHKGDVFEPKKGVMKLV
jgi:RecG-like helicase